MFTETACLLVGILPGWLLRTNRQAMRLVVRVTTLAIYALLFILGAKLGGNHALLASLGQIGIQGLTIGVLCLTGSVLCVMPAERFFHSSLGREPRQETTPLIQGLKGPLCILACFCVGLALARMHLLPPRIYGGHVSLYILWVLLFSIGMGMGFDLGALRLIRELGLRVLLVPLLTIAGTVLGAGVAFLLLDLDLHAILCVASGFGYFSLSSVVITEMHSPMLGSVALLANVFRELFTLVATPFLVRFFGPLAPIGACAAPAMDVCLPVIVQFSGESYGFVALFTGLLFTMCVPLWLPFILGL